MKVLVRYLYEQLQFRISASLFSKFYGSNAIIPHAYLEKTKNITIFAPELKEL